MHLPPRTRALTRSLALLLVFALAGAPALPAQWTGPAADSVRAILEQRVEREAARGIIAAYADAAGVHVAAAGHRAGAGSPAINAESVFEIGSISKVFTTTLLAEMVARGEVALEDPVQRHLPDSVRMPVHEGREITLVDLATHTSGLPRLPTNLRPADPTNPYADYDARALYAFLAGHTLARAPGALFEYSNLGMGLLGHVLALRAGTPYEQLVRDRILTPLDMHDTRISLTPELRARLATGHGADLGAVSNWDLPTLAGAGAWRSTAPDMARFAQALLAPPPGTLGTALRSAMEPLRPAGSGMRVALGWIVIEREAGTIVMHNGQTGGYHAFLGVAPSTGANVVVLANTATDIDDIGMHLLDRSVPLREIAPPRATVAVDAATLERYVGRYELAPTFSIQVTREGDALYAQATNQPRFRLFAASATRFFLRTVEAEVSFTISDEGAVTGLVLHQGGREMPGRKVEE